MAQNNSTSEFRFKVTDTIGLAAAEDDGELLRECFVDTGLLDLLRDYRDRRLIVLGRTGAGKSALLTTLQASAPERVIRISPEQLALTYVANSTILTYFASLGVNLDPFFKLLWRHVLAVEILARHLERHGEKEEGIAAKLKLRFIGATKTDKEMREAVDYLDEFTHSFWQDTEYRVKEITTEFESRLDRQHEAAVGMTVAGIRAGSRGGEGITETQRAEVQARAQEVISAAQIEDLGKILRLIDKLVSDRQAGYYVIIDDLDANWVEDKLKYKLIMALMQTARDFSSQVGNVKVVLALRRDLLDRVFRLARDSGFQEEKYQSLYLPLVWTKDAIIDVLDRRVTKMVSRRYTKQEVRHKDVLPGTYEGMPIDDFISMVAQRPRDVIAFFNDCIKAAVGHTKLELAELRQAEGEYSKNRLRALADEWSADYPRLADFAKLLQQAPPSFPLSSIPDSKVGELCLDLATEHGRQLGLLATAAQVANGHVPSKQFKHELFETFYRVGLVGLRLTKFDSTSWADELGKSVAKAAVNEETVAEVHPAFRRALGVVHAVS